MINGLDIFYTKLNKGEGLKIVENEGDGLKIVKGKGCYMTKNNYKKISKRVWSSNFKIIFHIIYERL